MKVTYMFNHEVDDDDFYQHKIFQKSNEMYIALVEISEYMRVLDKETVEDDKEQIVEKIMDIICESGIGEIE